MGSVTPRVSALRQLRSLAVGEALNIPLQAVIWFGWVELPASASNVAGYAAFALLLAEGTAYWVAKRAQVSRGLARLPGVGWFRWARRVNVVVLTAALGYTVISTVAAPSSATIPGLVFAAAAIGEHVNYFHLQLVRGVRRSHLSRDLAQGRPDRQPSPARGGSSQAR
jgi:hypothetical protein